MDELTRLRAENTALNHQLDDLEGSSRNSVVLARKYWSAWRQRGRELARAIDERERARSLAARLEQENAHLMSMPTTVIPVDLAGNAQDSRPNTRNTTNTDGSTHMVVKRCCNGCGREIGDADVADLSAAISGAELPDVRTECGCG